MSEKTDKSANYGNRYFNTGEFAKLCRTTKDTLLYYDKIGILKPRRNGENDYRVYSSEQFFDYDLINMLKRAGSSLKEIKWYLNHYDAENFLKLLRDKEEQIKRQRRELLKMEKMLQHTINMTEQALKEVYDIPYVERQEAETLLTVRLAPGEGESVYGNAARLGEHFSRCEEMDVVDKFPLGSIILKEEILAGGSEESYFFSRISDEGSGKDIQVKPAGRYAAVVHRGNYDSFAAVYRQLLTYIREEGLKVTGNAYVYELISYMASETQENYVMKISVGVE